MAKRTVIDHKTGFTNEFITEDNKDIYHTTQDLNPIIEHCKILADNRAWQGHSPCGRSTIDRISKSLSRRMGQ